ncbi:MAG: hypothetical protein JXB49_08865 [Bacteroidales bacterium]|nr:hypothetical protein [Bacteroidales bacterium]
MKTLNKKLEVEKENLLSQKDLVLDNPLLGPSEFHSISKKIKLDEILFYFICVSEIFLNYISTLIFIPGEGLLFGALRFCISFVLTGAAIITSEKLIESLFPIYEEKEGHKHNYKMTIMLIILLMGVEISIIGVASKRAYDIEGNHESGWLYYGFIILSMVLPLIAGAIRWYILKYWDAYKNTLKLYFVENKLTKLEAEICTNEEKAQGIYQKNVNAYFYTFTSFQTCKQNYNVKKGIEEDISSHFCFDFNSFQKEADKRMLSNHHLKFLNGNSEKEMNTIFQIK